MSQSKYLQQAGLLNEVADYKDIVSRDKKPQELVAMCTSFSCHGSSNSKYGAIKDRLRCKDDLCHDCGATVFYQVLEVDQISRIKWKQQNRNKKGGVTMMLLVGIAFVCMVSAVLVYLFKEDTAFHKTLRTVKSAVEGYEKTQTSHIELTKRVTQVQVALDVNRELIGKLQDRMQMLEMRLDAQKAAVLSAKVPETITVRLRGPVAIQTQPVPFKPIQKKRTPLLDRAGVTKVRVKGPQVSQ